MHKTSGAEAKQRATGGLTRTWRLEDGSQLNDV